MLSPTTYHCCEGIQWSLSLLASSVCSEGSMSASCCAGQTLPHPHPRSGLQWHWHLHDSDSRLGRWCWDHDSGVALGSVWCYIVWLRRHLGAEGILGLTSIEGERLPRSEFCLEGRMYPSCFNAPTDLPIQWHTAFCA